MALRGRPAGSPALVRGTGRGLSWEELPGLLSLGFAGEDTEAQRC